MLNRALVLVVLLAACTKEESGDLFTRGMHPSMSATADGDGSTEVVATLYEDVLEFIELTDGDRLVAWQGTTSRVMSEFEFLNIVSYRATFDIDDADTAFRVQFEREVDEGAPNSMATLPAPFDLTAPDAASRAAEMTITWAPSGGSDPMAWEVQGECIDATSGSIADVGTITLPAGAIVKKMQQDGQPVVADSCAVTLRVRRTRSGSVDPAFEEGGSFTGSQVRSAMFTSNP